MEISQQITKKGFSLQAYPIHVRHSINLRQRLTNANKYERMKEQ